MPHSCCPTRSPRHRGTRNRSPAKVFEALAHDLTELTVEWHQRAGAPRAGSIARRLINLLPAQPVIDARTVAAALEVDKRTAQRGIQWLAKAEVLREVTGYRRNRIWAAEELFDLLDGAQLAIERDAGGHRPAAFSRCLRPGGERSPGHTG